MSASLSDVEILSKLADQYRDKGKDNPRKNWPDILKAHTLYNACASRSSNKKWREQAFEVQKIYWGDNVSSTLKQQIELAHDFQDRLYTIRDECKDDLSPVTDLINRWDCKTDNLNSADNKEITRHLVKEMKILSFVGNAKMKVFAGKVIQQGVHLLRKKAPCKFAAVALGSMAKGEATPYSDLEFMFLLEKKSPEIIEYFESLAMTVYFLIGNLQETKLKYMNILELGKFKDKGKNGFKIDGLQSKAGNIPTGNGTEQQQNKFILTVDELSNQYQHIFLNPDPEESKKGDFTSMLAQTTVIYGEASLLTDFEQRRKIVVINEARMNAHNSMIKQDVEDYDFLPLWQLARSNHSADLKSAIYRFPSILTYNLKIIYTIESKTSWETLDKLYQMKNLSQSFYVSLQFLLASAFYIRMAAYLHHDSQNDYMTFVPSSEPSTKGLFWHLPKPLYLHMSLHMIPVKLTIAALKDPLHAVTTEIFYDISVVSAHVNYYAGNYAEALKVLETFTFKSFYELAMLVDCYSSLQQWNKYQSEVYKMICYIHDRHYNLFLTSLLPYIKYRAADGYRHAGDLAAAKKGFEEVLIDLPSHLSYNHEIYAQASSFYLLISDEIKSEHYYAKACEQLEEIAQSASQSWYDIHRSAMLYSRATAMMRKVRYREAETLLLQNIQILKRIYGENGICDQLATAYQSLGSLYGGLGQLQTSSEYIHKALELYNSIIPAKEEKNFIVLYNNMALVYHRQGKPELSLAYYHKTLAQMKKYDTLSPPGVANLKAQIGAVLMQQGNNDEAARYFNDSIAIYESVNNSLYDSGHARCHLDYGQLYLFQGRHADSLNHFKKASSFRSDNGDIGLMDTLCQAWSLIGWNFMNERKYKEAISCLEKSASHHTRQSLMSTKSYAMIYHNIGWCYLQSSMAVPATVQEDAITHTKAHKAFVKALSLLSSPSLEEDDGLTIILVAAQIFEIWWMWRG